MTSIEFNLKDFSKWLASGRDTKLHHAEECLGGENPEPSKEEQLLNLEN